MAGRQPRDVSGQERQYASVVVLSTLGHDTTWLRTATTKWLLEYDIKKMSNNSPNNIRNNNICLVTWFSFSSFSYNLPLRLK